jgi:hypothetical protein
MFRTVPGQSEGKYFWTTRVDAERFARQLATRLKIQPSWVVEVRLTPGVVSALVLRDMDRRPARFVPESDLDWFNRSTMKLVLPSLESPVA